MLSYLRGEASDALHKILVRLPVTSDNLTQNRDNLETVEIIEPAETEIMHRLIQTSLKPRLFNVRWSLYHYAMSKFDFKVHNEKAAKCLCLLLRLSASKESCDVA